MLGGSKFQKWATRPPHDPFLPNFAFFSLVLTVFHLYAKFEVSSFIHPDILGRSKNFLASFIPEILGVPENSKSGSRDPTCSLLT